MTTYNDLRLKLKKITNTWYYTNNETDTLLNSKEDNSNKVTSWTATTTDTHYPSEKLVKDSLDSLNNLIGDAIIYINQ